MALGATWPRSVEHPPLGVRVAGPEAVVLVAGIPKTSVGKFDKKFLRSEYRDYALPGA